MNHQRIWDEELIDSWIHFRKTIGVIYGFTERASPILYKLKDPARMVNWIGTLNLKRCPWQQIDGKTNKYPWNIQTRALIHSFSPQMDGSLYSDKIKNSDIIDNIDNFKWYDKPIVNRQRQNECANELNRKRTTKTIRMRSLSKNHDWNTVK